MTIEEKVDDGVEEEGDGSDKRLEGGYHCGNYQMISLVEVITTGQEPV